MIGHGQYHKLVPRDPLANLQFRKSVIEESFRSERTRKLLWRACQDDVLFFINVFGWQTNPDKFGEEDGPFICFDFQERALLISIQKLYYERIMVVWEKSRKQGGTFLALFKEVWLNIFHKRKRSLLMSHNEKAVEQTDDEDTLFGKIDFIIGHLPSWMQDGHPRSKSVYRMKKTKSQIVGTTTTKRTGVGNRASSVVGDEVSKWNKADEILSQLKDTGPVLAIGTHYGVGGTWFDLCKSPTVYKIVFHWSMNPLYNRGLYRSDPTLQAHERVVDPKDNPLPSDYPMVTDGSPHGGPYPGLRSIQYDDICRTRPSREVAIHWDIDPAGAARQFFNVNMLRDYIIRYARPPEWQGDIEYDPSGMFRRLKERDNGPLRLWVRPEREEKPILPSLYKVGGDVSAGTGATPSCLSGIDAMTGKKILEYLDARIEPAPFARLAIAVCWMLKDPAGNPAQIIWDRSGPTGGKFGQAIVELGFRNFWYWRDEFTLNPKISDIPGWFANPNSIRALFGDYNEALEKGQVLNPSENALKECLAFEYVVGGLGIAHGESLRTEDPSAGRLNHSDMAQADALAVKLYKESGGTRDNPEERLKQNAVDGDYGWNEDGPTYGWLIQQADRGRTKNPFRR